MTEPRRNRRLQDYTDRIGGELEPRISRDDERDLNDRTRSREWREARADVIATVARIDGELDQLAADLNALSRAGASLEHSPLVLDSRSTLRMARRAMTNVVRGLPS